MDGKGAGLVEGAAEVVKEVEEGHELVQGRDEAFAAAVEPLEAVLQGSAGESGAEGVPVVAAAVTAFLATAHASDASQNFVVALVDADAERRH